jgi:hypothetical protein
MVRIEKGMGQEIIRHMETTLHRPDKMLLCARYDERPGAINAFYVDRYGTKTISWYWYKLKEEVKNFLTDSVHVVTVHESKLQLDEFLKFLTHEKAPIFKVTAQFEQAIRNAMPSDLVLDFVRAGINLEQADRGLSNAGA